MAIVTINQGESIESALRRFKRKVMTEEIIKDAKKHAFFIPPGQKAKLKSALARKRNKKKGRMRTTPPRLTGLVEPSFGPHRAFPQSGFELDQVLEPRCGSEALVRSDGRVEVS
jgi:small subunit ribosomal protein S21